MKTKIKKILLSVNEECGTKAAIQSALTLAKANDASIKVVKVVDNLAKLIRVAKPILQRIVNVRKEITHELEHKIANNIKPSNDLAPISCKVLEGVSFIEIIKEVIRYNYDILITSRIIDRKSQNNFLNSNTLHLIRKCPCPVWVVDPSNIIKFDRILLAVDLDPSNKVKQELNHKMMEMTLHIAKLFNSKVHVYYAWELYGEKTLRSRFMAKIKKSEFEKKIMNEKILAKKRMDDFLSDYHEVGVSIQGEIGKGDPIKVVPEQLIKKNINLLVMGTVSRIDIPGLIIGNTAEEILNKINCSVLTLKPDGFVSPV